jgi:hypothetical protein
VRAHLPKARQEDSARPFARELRRHGSSMEYLN